MVFPLKITHNTFDVLSPLICFKYSITYSIQLVLQKKKKKKKEEEKEEEEAKQNKTKTKTKNKNKRKKQQQKKKHTTKTYPCLGETTCFTSSRKAKHYNLEKPSWRRHKTGIDMATEHQGQQAMLVSVNHRWKLLYHIDNIYDHVKLAVKSGKASAAKEINCICQVITYKNKIKNKE